MLGRIYLGMHSLIDIIGGLGIGLVILAFGLQFMNMSTILLFQDKMVSILFLVFFFYKDSIFLLILDSLQILDS